MGRCERRQHRQSPGRIAQPGPDRWLEVPFPGKVSREKGQDEEDEIPQVERVGRVRSQPLAEEFGKLDRDAGGDDIEEAAVCYLQILLADYLPGVGRDRLMQDMDAWGYSFRLGSSRAWFESDAADARAWLLDRALLIDTGTPTFELRK